MAMLGEPSVPDYYRAALEKVKEEVRSKDDAYILGIDLDEYTKYLYEDYALPIIETDDSRSDEIEKIRKKKVLETISVILTSESRYVLR